MGSKDIRERWAAAPSAPWEWSDQPDGVIRISFLGAHNGLTIARVIFPGDMETYEGADLDLARALAHAPADIAYLLNLNAALMRAYRKIDNALQLSAGLPDESVAAIREECSALVLAALEGGR